MTNEIDDEDGPRFPDGSAVLLWRPPFSADDVLVLGLRKGEVIGIPRNAVDLDTGELDIAWQLQRVRRQLLHRGSAQVPEILDGLGSEPARFLWMGLGSRLGSAGVSRQATFHRTRR
jgi:hypothetical protein